jgi:hypothetical protein
MGDVYSNGEGTALDLLKDQRSALPIMNTKECAEDATGESDEKKQKLRAEFGYFQMTMETWKLPFQ